MKIIHFPFGYFPDVHGGTEVYVAALCRELSALGCKNTVVAPGCELARYTHEGIEVYRYLVGESVPDVARNGEGDPLAAEHAGSIFDELKPDIVHLHALTSGVSLKVLREAKVRGIKTVITYHTPTISCARGTLLYMGKTLCEGAMDKQRCTACSLQGLGLNTGMAKAVANIPAWVGKSLARFGVQARWLTALRRGEMVGIRHDTVRKVFAEVDHVIALCDWTETLLRLNGLAVGKTSVIRHTLPHETGDKLPKQITIPPVFSHDEPLRLLCLGRIAPEKGVDIILQAVASLSAELPVTLDIYGLSQDDGDYVREVIGESKRDHRINLHEPVPPEDVTSLLRQYHLLLVPSQWLETGPFVVLESLFARAPVIGSKLGGIEERVRSEIDGLLVDEYFDPKAWSDKLQSLLNEPKKIVSMRELIESPAGFDEVAMAHLKIYRQCLEGAAH